MKGNEAGIAHGGGSPSRSTSVLDRLTPREREVLDLIGRGLSTAEIAERLHRSQKTVKSHRLALGRKLGVSNRVELARVAIEAGLAPLVSPPAETASGRPGVREDSVSQQRAHHALRSIDAGIAVAAGEDVFQRLVRRLTEALGVMCAMVARMDDSERDVMHVMASWRGDGPGPVKSVHAISMACKTAMRDGVTFIRANAREKIRIPEPFDDPSIDSYLATALRDADGRPIGALAALHDGPIDEAVEPEMILRIFADRASAELQRRKAECARRASEKLHRLVAENVPALVAYVDRTERYRYVNEAYAAWIGRPCDQIVGRTVREVLGDVRFADFEPRLRRALAGERMNYEKHSRSADGRESRRFSVLGAPDLSDRGDLVGVYFLATDITDRMEAVN